MKTDILLLNKTAYENGRISGEYFKNKVSQEIRDQLLSIKKNAALMAQCRSLLEKLKQEYPEYYDEVAGKADGLELPVEDYFALLCPEVFNLGFEHCTTIVCRKPNGHYLLSHNEDDFYYENNFCLSKVKIDDEHWFVTNDMINMPFGNGFSWNSYGIVKTINYCHEESFNLDYLPRYFSQRHISTASSIDDLIKRCQEMKIASGYHVTAIDMHNHIAVSIEVYNDAIDVEIIDDCYVHTNHYIHKEHCLNQKTDPGSNSVFRLEKAKELLSQSHRDADSIKKILNYRSPEDRFDNSIFQKEADSYLTLANILVETDKKDVILLDVYVNGDHLNLSYLK